ncbi:MAG: protein kinase [Anaerolineae bacterium]
METRPLPIGATLKDKYTVTQLVAGGGMAWVYRAEERRPDGATRTWALKELRAASDDLAVRAEGRRLFEQEARILAGLRHRNLPRVAGSFEQDGRSYLVMEFVAGESLQKRLNEANAPLLEDEVIAWAIQICDVLSYLHAQNPPVIFRDMKPSNVMVTPDGTIKLIDFGIARTYKAGKLRDTIAMGSENYAAPEQWGTAQTDARADVYGLGATMYHLLANVPPTPAFLPAPPVPLHQYNPAVSEQLAAVVEKAMAQDREQRYATAAYMQGDLYNCRPDLSRGAGRRGSMGAREQGSRGAGEQGSTGAEVTGSRRPKGAAAASQGQCCPDCQAANRLTARFCRRCGRSFVGVLPARLRIVQPAGVSWEMPIRGETMLVGRRSQPEELVPDLDLAFYDPDAYVSRRHATITHNDQRYEIVDLDSDNGTFVNDGRLAAGEKRVLRNGDRIRVGRVVLGFVVG